MKRRLLAILLTVCMVLTMSTTALAADSVFTDVNANDWFAEAVEFVYDIELMHGVGNNRFDPEGTVTRAMVWATLTRLAGEDEASTPWWAAAQKWTMDNDISDGTYPDNNVTREQLVAMLYRFTKNYMMGVDVSAGESTDLSSFSDAASISGWSDAVTSMKWAVGEDIINGFTDGTLQPQGNATRAQLAMILYRFVLYLNDNVPNEPVDPTPTPDTEEPVDPTPTPEVTPVPHKHSYGDWATNDDGTHSQTCTATVGTCDEKTVTENCNFVEGVCEVCGYVENAVAKIGDTYFASLEDAIKTAKDGETIILLAGTHTLPEFAGKELTFKGADKATTFINDYVNKGSQGMMGSTVHFEDLTVNGRTDAGDNYWGLYHTNEVSYSNCIVNGNRFLFAPTVSFTGCDFVAGNAEHSVWTYGAQNVSFTDCDFTYGDRGINCYSDDDVPGGKQVVNFTKCTFSTDNTGSAGAVEINSCYFSVGIEVNMTNCTAPAYGEMAYVSQWDSAKGAKTSIIVDGVYQISSQEALSAAIARGATNMYLADGSYYMPSCQGKTITIKGGTGAIIDASHDSYGYQVLSGANITFDGVTIKGTDSNFSCKGFQHAKVAFNECTIVNELILNENSVFTDCTFNTTGNIYSIWTWGARTATFTRCTFNTDGKAILLYGGANGTPTGEITTVLTLDTCTFNDKGGLDAKKAAVEIGNGYTNANYKLVVNNTTVNGYEINDEGINTGSTLWGNKNSMGTDTLNVIIDGVDVY